ncbi:hypothetical protein [Devosia sp. LjRoot3]|uniref:hypothetical protein n=1 Tax=Devosia sp. LjRoot3 TaxID=3342319 RepID=UPI003ECE8DF4
MTSSTPAGHGRAEKNIADCGSVAKAEIFATALDNAGHPVGTNVGQLLLDQGFQGSMDFPQEVARELMDKVCEGHPGSTFHTRYSRRWFATKYLSLLLTLTRTGMFPLYCFALAKDWIVRPDSLLIDSRLWKNGAFAPVVPTFSVAYLEIMKLRIKENGSRLPRLLDGQQHALIDLLAAGYRWPDAEPEAEPLMLGMGR